MFRRFFRRSPAHRLVGEQTQFLGGRPGIRYRCEICTLTFDSAQSASKSRCLEKRCYYLYESRPLYLMTRAEIEATGRRLCRVQVVLAYEYNSVWAYPASYTPLYDVREAFALPGAFALPSFERNDEDAGSA